jgi:hypothetical protein
MASNFERIKSQGKSFRKKLFEISSQAAGQTRAAGDTGITFGEALVEALASKKRWAARMA